MAAIPLPATALSWQWSFRRPADAASPAVHAIGVLISTESPDASGFYTINSVMGGRNSVLISGLLPAGSVAPGNCYSIQTCFTSDNLLRTIQGGAAQLTSHGFNVGFTDGTYANYFFIPPTGPQPPDSELQGLFEAKPIPAPLPIAGAFIGLGWMRRLRRRGMRRS